MTLSRTILNIDDTDTSPDGVSWSHADKTKFVEVNTVQAANGRETVYQKTDGDDLHPMTVRVGHYPNQGANGGAGQANISIKVSTFVKYLDADIELEAYYPCSATIALNMPGIGGVPNVSDVLLLLQNTFSWVQPLAEGNFSDSVIEQLRFGVTSAARVVDDPTA